MDNTDSEEPSRRRIKKAYGVASLLQMTLGVLLITSGIIGLKYLNKDEISIYRPPYFLGAFFVGIVILCAGVCTLYVFITEAPLIDYYYLEQPAAKKIKRAVTGNTIGSVIALIGSILGLALVVIFAVAPCDTDDWFTKCSFLTKSFEHRTVAIFITVFLSACAILSVYTSIMSCEKIHGWVFDFDACVVTMRQLKQKEKESQNGHDSVRPVSSFQPVPIFDDDEPDRGEFMQNDVKYNATSSFKQPNEHRYTQLSDDSYDDEYVSSRKMHIQSTQPPNYIAVLNDPAMKQKLQERNSRLQSQN